LAGFQGTVISRAAVGQRARRRRARIDEFDPDTGGPFNDGAHFRGIAIENLPAEAI
jgi:hypothetical protein